MPTQANHKVFNSKYAVLRALFPEAGFDLSGPLTDTDLRDLLQLTTNHRIAGFLYNSRCQSDLWPHTLPDWFINQLNIEAKREANHNLGLLKGWLALHDELSRIGLDVVPLKGMSLALWTYSSLELRPMRDIDILVLGGKQISAWQHLHSLGSRILTGNGDNLIEIDRESKHLPALIWQTPIPFVVEIHKAYSETSATNADLNLFQRTEFLDQLTKQPLGKRSFLTMSDTHMLIHLCVHAVEDSNLNNGPVVFRDIQTLVLKEQINWDELLEFSRQLEGFNSICLILACAQRLYPKTLDGKIPSLFLEHAPNQEMISIAILSTLSDPKLHLMRDVLSVSGSFLEISKKLLKRIFPNKSRRLKRYASQKSLTLQIKQYWLRPIDNLRYLVGLPLRKWKEVWWEFLLHRRLSKYLNSRPPQST